MKIINRIMQPMARRLYSLADLDRQMDELISGSPVSAGVNVSEYSALNYSAFWACVNRLADGVALPPLHLYRRLDKGKERATNHPLYKILHDAPNPMMSSFTFRRTLEAHIVTWGNGYAYIDWKNGQVEALWPINPARITPKRVDDKLVFVFKRENGTELTYQQEQIFHVPGLGFDGIRGYSVVSKAKEAIGLGLATERFGSTFFGNGALSGGSLEHPSKLTPEAHERLTKSWNEAHQGPDKAHKVAILEEGMKFNKTSIPPDDAQFLETRKFQVEEMARWFNIPLMLIQTGGETPTFASSEQFMLSYKIFTLMPHHENWEQAIQQQLLLTDEERDEYYTEFLMDGLLRGDSISRGTFYTQMFNIGVLSPNDIRELENLNPVDGGDQYFVGLNMVPTDKAEAPVVEPNVKSLRSVQTDVRLKKAQNKLKVVNSYRSVMDDAASRLVKRQVQDITKQLKKDPAEFKTWLEEYYKKQPEVMRQIMSPAFIGLGEAVQKCAAEECGGKVGMTPELTECLNTHVELSSKFNSEQALGKLQKVIGQADGTRDAGTWEEVKAALTTELSTWEKKIPSMITNWELTRTAGMISKATYFYSGAKGIEWVTVGDVEMCPDLDGVSRAISANCRSDAFVPKNRALSSVCECRGLQDFTPSWNVYTPPLYNGCTCQILPKL